VDQDENPEALLRLRDLLPGLLSRLGRSGSTLKAAKEMLNISVEQHNSLGMVIERNAAAYPDKRALLYENLSLTHSELNQRANRYANYLHSVGVRKGDVAVLFLENRPELITLIAAFSKLGAIASLINPNQRQKVLLHSVNLARGSIFIVGEEMLDPFEEIRSELDLKQDDHVYFLPDGSELPAPEGYLDLPEFIKDFPSTNPQTTSQVQLGDPFAYVFTSGTTGMPKASIQPNLRWVQAGNWFGRFNMALTSDDTMYIPLPLNHTNGLNVAWGGAAGVGAAIAIRRKFSASAFWEDTRRFKATSFIYIGEVCRYLMNQSPGPDDSRNPIRKIVGNGLRPDIWKAFKKRFQIPYVYELYGAAEANMIFTNFFNIDCCVGLCLTPYTIVKYDLDADQPIRGKDGLLIPVGRGQTGLMLAKITERTPFLGYTSKAETEKKILQDVLKKGDRWFNTGDLMRDIGFKHAQFVDRLGDTFRWKGENVSTTQVEEAVSQVKKVAGCTVYGVAISGTEGRAGMVAIVTDTMKDDVDKKELARVLRSSLPSYAVPIFVRIKTAFETTATHKIKKTALKAEGFDPQVISDPLYLMRPGETEYTRLTRDVHQGILDGRYRF
jgi:citronellyl-CoA synthetase